MKFLSYISLIVSCVGLILSLVALASQRTTIDPSQLSRNAAGIVEVNTPRKMTFNSVSGIGTITGGKGEVR